MNEIATELGKSAAQILIRWAVQRGTSVVPKSVTAERIRSNIDVISWELSKEQMTKLNSVEAQKRMLVCEFFCGPTSPYKTPAHLWDEFPPTYINCPGP